MTKRIYKKYNLIATNIVCERESTEYGAATMQIHFDGKLYDACLRITKTNSAIKKGYL